MYDKEEWIPKIIDAYNDVVCGVEKKAKDNKNGRAYGGVIRASKGKMVEDIANYIVKIAWNELGGELSRLEVIKQRVKIPIDINYLEKIDENVRLHIKRNIDSYFYPLAMDWLVKIDGLPFIAIECKAYTENAMIKRILVDCSLMKKMYPNLNFVLFQLESQLGGDYSNISKLKFGSPSTHSILSHFDINLEILTLLEGERKVNRPIHKKEFFKELKEDSLDYAVDVFINILKNYK